MELDRPGDFVDVFICTCFSEENGWSRVEPQSIEYRHLDYIFQRFDGEEVLIERLQEPIVSSHVIQQASKLATTRKRSNAVGGVNAIIVCGQLLTQPSKTPDNVRVVSLVENKRSATPEEAFVSEN